MCRSVVVAAALPDGIALSPNAGVSSGTPTAPGSFTSRRGGYRNSTALHASCHRDEDINSHRGFRPGSASDHEPIAASDDRAAPDSQTLTASGGTAAGMCGPR